MALLHCTCHPSASFKRCEAVLATCAASAEEKSWLKGQWIKSDCLSSQFHLTTLCYFCLWWGCLISVIKCWCAFEVADQAQAVLTCQDVIGHLTQQITRFLFMDRIHAGAGCMTPVFGLKSLLKSTPTSIINCCSQLWIKNRSWHVSFAIHMPWWKAHC